MPITPPVSKLALLAGRGQILPKICSAVRSWPRLPLSGYTCAAALMSTALLFGCVATGAQFKPEANKPTKGALLYVYRPHTLIGIANADVPIMHLDG